jgi:hypothetical protein
MSEAEVDIGAIMLTGPKEEEEGTDLMSQLIEIYIALL